MAHYKKIIFLLGTTLLIIQDCAILTKQQLIIHSGPKLKIDNYSAEKSPQQMLSEHADALNCYFQIDSFNVYLDSLPIYDWHIRGIRIAPDEKIGLKEINAEKLLKEGKIVFIHSPGDDETEQNVDEKTPQKEEEQKEKEITGYRKFPVIQLWSAADNIDTTALAEYLYYALGWNYNDIGLKRNDNDEITRIKRNNLLNLKACINFRKKYDRIDLVREMMLLFDWPDGMEIRQHTISDDILVLRYFNMYDRNPEIFLYLGIIARQNDLNVIELQYLGDKYYDKPGADNPVVRTISDIHNIMDIYPTEKLSRSDYHVRYNFWLKSCYIQADSMIISYYANKEFQEAAWNLVEEAWDDLERYKTKYAVIQYLGKKENPDTKPLKPRVILLKDSTFNRMVEKYDLTINKPFSMVQPLNYQNFKNYYWRIINKNLYSDIFQLEKKTLYDTEDSDQILIANGAFFYKSFHKPHVLNIYYDCNDLSVVSRQADGSDAILFKKTRLGFKANNNVYLIDMGEFLNTPYEVQKILNKYVKNELPLILNKNKYYDSGKENAAWKEQYSFHLEVFIDGIKQPLKTEVGHLTLKSGGDEPIFEKVSDTLQIDREDYLFSKRKLYISDPIILPSYDLSSDYTVLPDTVCIDIKFKLLEKDYELTTHNIDREILLVEGTVLKFKNTEYHADGNGNIHINLPAEKLTWQGDEYELKIINPLINTISFKILSIQFNK